jgi:tetrahydromethanopterin S-methyltransferase subunit D
MSHSGQALFLAILIGVIGGSLIFIALASLARDAQSRKALALASYSVGMMASWFFYKNPAVLAAVAEETAWKTAGVIAVALVFATLFFLRK